MHLTCGGLSVVVLVTFQVADVHYVDNKINSTDNSYCKDLTPEQKLYPCTDKNSTDFLAGLLER